MLKLFPNISAMLEQIHIFKTGIWAELTDSICVFVCVYIKKVLITDVSQQRKENNMPPEFSAKMLWPLSVCYIEMCLVLNDDETDIPIIFNTLKL